MAKSKRSKKQPGKSDKATPKGGKAKNAKQKLMAANARRFPSGRTLTSKLGQIYPPDADGPFKLSWRYPGFHPDTSEDDDGNGQNLYPDEAIKSDARQAVFSPFPGPAGKKGPFWEPEAGAGAAEWKEFNKWILGGSLPLEKTGEKLFTALLRDLAVCVRRYNASLYRLRRLHYYYYHPRSAQPAKNKFGDPELPPIDPARPIEKLVEEAEENWRLVTELLKNSIDQPDPKYGFNIRAADMIEVNGYIVSMRIIALPAIGLPKGGNKHTDEIGGSSSHISISSAFSSYPYPDDP